MSDRSSDMRHILAQIQNIQTGLPLAEADTTEPQVKELPPAFKAWFGASKVVDGEGKPLVVIHGTDASFTAFDRAKAGKGPSKFGFWFTDDPNLSCHFGENQMRVYLRMVRPKVITITQWNSLRDKHHGDGDWFSRWRETLRGQGFDGLIVRGDTFHGSRMTMKDPDVFAVFDANQIKSAERSGYSDGSDDIHETV
jgi:hypothetical protein